jgi:hypothetical protein
MVVAALVRDAHREIHEWGSTAAERGRVFPCDSLIDDAQQELFRAIEVNAPAETLFRWLCQLRAAPYSYDRLDNLGRRSPRELTPGLERLEVGQRVMTVFRLAAFEQGRSLTLISRGRVFGAVVCTYEVSPLGPHASRLLVKLLVCNTGPGRRLMQLILPAGDLVMMRRQLLNLKGLAETEAAGSPPPGRAPGRYRLGGRLRA